MYLRKILGKIVPTPFKNFIKKELHLRSLSFSQAGQDFWVYGEVFNEKEGGYFVEIGAHDGLVISNTYFLEKKYHWDGICIEANPFSFEKLKENRSASCLNICLDQAEGEVNFALNNMSGGIVDEDLDNSDPSDDIQIIKLKTRPLLTVLQEQNAPSVIDYLSMDVEGAEERILGNFDFDQYIFRCITLERPSENLQQLLEENNYRLIKQIPGLDYFYIHESFVKNYLHNVLQFYEKNYVKMRWNR